MRVVDLEGKTLMPGLIEGHFHISFWGVRELPDLDLKLPAERTTVYAVKNAELALRCGYTGVASAGALHRIDVTIRDMVKEGVIAGPRMAASGRDICATSGMLDWNPSFWKLGMDGLSIFADGVDEVRKAVRKNISEGADVIKLYVTGEGLLRPGTPPEETMYSFEEIAVASTRRTSATGRSRRTSAATTASSSASRRASTSSSTRPTPTTRRSR